MLLEEVTTNLYHSISDFWIDMSDEEKEKAKAEFGLNNETSRKLIENYGILEAIQFEDISDAEVIEFVLKIRDGYYGLILTKGDIFKVIEYRINTK